MAQGKNNKKKETGKGKAPFIGLSQIGTRSRHGQTRTRIRDFLCEINKNLDDELQAQETALAEGFDIEGTLTMTKDEMAHAKAALQSMAALWKTASKDDGKTMTNLISDLQECCARLDAYMEGKVKALTPDEKKAALAEQEELLRMKAELDAKLSALGDLNL